MLSDNTDKWIIKPDSIILFFAVMATINIIPHSTRLYFQPVILSLLALQILTDVFYYYNEHDNLGGRAENSHSHAKLIITVFIILLTVIPSAVYTIYARQAEMTFSFPHDGGVTHTEEAMKYFLKGENPYTENYFNTALEMQYESTKSDYGLKTIIYHYPYLPFTFIFPVPFYLAIQNVSGWFDMRIIYLSMFLLLLIILPRFCSGNQEKAILLTLFSLNPFFTIFFINGRNDIFIFFWIVLALLFLKKEKILLSSLFLGLACASKPTAWFFLPFYFVYLWKKYCNGFGIKETSFWIMKKNYPILICFLLFVLPFLSWDFSSFKNDVFDFNLGTAGASSYPLGGTPGYGFSDFLLIAGYAKDSYFPFSYLQAIFAFPLLLFLIKKQTVRNSIRTAGINYAIFLFVFLFFSRFFHNNYIGYSFFFLCLGTLSDE